MLGADVLERLGRLSPGQPGIGRVAQGARGLTELPQHFCLQQPVLEALRLEYSDPEGCDARVERSPFALDSRATFEGLSDREMVAPCPRALERRCARTLCVVEFPDRHPDQSEVQRQNVYHQRIAARTGNRKTSLEGFYRPLVVTELGVEHAEVVQNPRHRLLVIRPLERAEAIRVSSLGGDKVSAHVEKHAAVLFD